MYIFANLQKDANVPCSDWSLAHGDGQPNQVAKGRSLADVLNRCARADWEIVAAVGQGEITQVILRRDGNCRTPVQF